MKCIRILKDNQIIKVSDSQADHMVTSKKAEYVPRHIWRESKKPTEEPKPKVVEKVASLKKK